MGAELFHSDRQSLFATLLTRLTVLVEVIKYLLPGNLKICHNITLLRGGGGWVWVGGRGG